MTVVVKTWGFLLCMQKRELGRRQRAGWVNSRSAFIHKTDLVWRERGLSASGDALLGPTQTLGTSEHHSHF